MGTIITRKQGNKIYYLYHETYREKINKKDYGKVRGSGKSKVCTRSTYLGSAETILKSIKSKKSPVKDIFTVMQERRSTRAFSDQQVSRSDIEEIFQYAGLAPSAINLQPWEYVITYGEEKDRLVKRLEKARSELQVACGSGTAAPLPEKYANRSREAARVMKPSFTQSGKSFNQFVEEGSCSFYGAPVVIMVTINKLFPPLRYLDLGLSVSYLLLAVEAKGLGTCPIGLITAYAADIADVLSIPADRDIVLGIALGYADREAPENQFKTSRAPQEEILHWHE